MLLCLKVSIVISLQTNPRSEQLIPVPYAFWLPREDALLGTPVQQHAPYVEGFVLDSPLGSGCPGQSGL